jgi:2-polyprenyl-3-methyl-5-hydroxy-6-metoxy-1,4-benzoquinol methylase
MSMLIGDIGLFVTSARSDARLAALRHAGKSSVTAFDRLYTDAPQNDPWASSLPQYQYQRRKYEALARLIPARPYRGALDLGCGLGLFTERLAERAQQVLGIDISAVAISCAADRSCALKNVQFRQGDIMALGSGLGCFDLVVVADALYYLPTPIQDETLEGVVARLAEMLAPDGIVLVANHYFPFPNPHTLLIRRIRRAFSRSPALTLLSEHWRPFFLTSVLVRTVVQGAREAAK